MKSRKKSSRRLSVQSLEGRELMAGLIGLNAGNLTIDGTNANDTVVVNQIGGVVQVSMTHLGHTHIQNFAAAAVQQITFRGYYGDDYFANNTNIRSTAFGHAGNDTLLGGGNVDLLYGGYGNDRLYGRGGNDTMFGEDGDDWMYGGIGNDYMFGQNGNDRMYGEAGLDYLRGGEGHDVLDGGADADRLFGENGNDTLLGQAGNDLVYGGAGFDLLRGGLGDDYLYGEAGNDQIFGDAGLDRLVGGDGNDRLDGGYDGAADQLWGQLGADTFVQHRRIVFPWIAEDQIMDFNAAQGDTVVNVFH
jgi:Ca2+-binding RTX toxin-like protein